MHFWQLTLFLITSFIGFVPARSTPFKFQLPRIYIKSFRLTTNFSIGQSISGSQWNILYLLEWAHGITKASREEAPIMAAGYRIHPLLSSFCRKTSVSVFRNTAVANIWNTINIDLIHPIVISIQFYSLTHVSPVAWFEHFTLSISQWFLVYFQTLRHTSKSGSCIRVPIASPMRLKYIAENQHFSPP